MTRDVPATGTLEPGLTRAQLDVADDAGEAAWLIAGSIRRLELLAEAIHESRGAFLEPTQRLYEREIGRRLDRQTELLASIDATAKAALEADAHDLPDVVVRRRELRDLVRTEIGLAAAFTLSTDWQSPSSSASLARAAGRHTGAITAHHDDYKRDRHHDAAAFEAAYLAEHPQLVRDARAIMTSCGMSAFSTILTFLALGPVASGRVVMGAHTYHECAALLRSTFGRRLIEVDEGTPGAFSSAIARHRPRAVFVDTLCNADGVVVTDLDEVVQALTTAATASAHLVVDNTCLSDAFDPFAHVPRHSGIRPIVHESLTKYAQFGLDATTAGMIVACGEDADALDELREHLGTNVGDRAPLVLPPPDRGALTRRLTRIDRNSRWLADALSSVVEVAHPSLPHHPSFRAARGRRFRGGLITVPVAARDQESLIAGAIELAKERGVPLVVGTSFGFDTTRLYAVAGERPFLRIAVGTETISELPGLAAVLTDALRSTRSDPSGPRTFRASGASPS